MSDHDFLIDGVQVPRFLYGTAWKEDETRRLTELALQQGFRGIDTANQRHHYHEAAVGQAIGAAIASGLVTREELFVLRSACGADVRSICGGVAPGGGRIVQCLATNAAQLSPACKDVLAQFAAQ